MIRIISIGLGIWLLALILAPLMIQSGIPFLQYPGTAVYFLADPVCHQLPERSFFIDEMPMPVCVRCFSIYLGGFFLFTFALVKQPLRIWPKWIYFVTAAFLSIEILTEHLNVYQNSFKLRLFSGFILGILLFRIVLETIAKEKVHLKNG